MNKAWKDQKRKKEQQENVEKAPRQGREIIEKRKYKIQTVGTKQGK